MNKFQKFVRYAAVGQTMIEALVALTAAVIIISSITVAVITSASNTSYSTNQNKATQLAREGLDALRKYRDTNTAEFRANAGMYCYKDQIIISEATKVNKPSECDITSRIEDAYIRTLHFIPAGATDNTCEDAVQVDSMVSWADGKCPANNQFCKNVRLVSCFSGSLATVQSEDGLTPPPPVVTTPPPPPPVVTTPPPPPPVVTTPPPPPPSRFYVAAGSGGQNCSAAGGGNNDFHVCWTYPPDYTQVVQNSYTTLIFKIITEDGRNLGSWGIISSKGYGCSSGQITEHDRDKTVYSCTFYVTGSSSFSVTGYANSQGSYKQDIIYFNKQ